MTVEEYKKFSEEHRDRMLTVQKLIDFLKTCNPNACILGFEINSNAYIEQLPELPSRQICTIADDKKHEIEFLEGAYANEKDRERRIAEHMSEIYRYAKDDDVVIRLGD